MNEFDPIFYLYANPDVAAAKADPRRHYETHGINEGREICARHSRTLIAREFRGRNVFFEDAFAMLAYNRISGDYAEFGCGGAATMTMAFAESQKHQLRRQFWAFDSFQGLPTSAGTGIDDHPEWTPGAYAIDQTDFERRCEMVGMSKTDLNIVSGFYEQSLPGAIHAATDIALAYVDCDLFSSTRQVLQFLRPRLKHGMVLALDDYYCYTRQTRSGEQAAFEILRDEVSEFVFEVYRPIGWHGQSFLVYRS